MLVYEIISYPTDMVSLLNVNTTLRCLCAPIPLLLTTCTLFIDIFYVSCQDPKHGIFYWVKMTSYLVIIMFFSFLKLKYFCIHKINIILISSVSKIFNEQTDRCFDKCCHL